VAEKQRRLEGERRQRVEEERRAQAQVPSYLSTRQGGGDPIRMAGSAGTPNQRSADATPRSHDGRSHDGAAGGSPPRGGSYPPTAGGYQPPGPLHGRRASAGYAPVARPAAAGYGIGNLVNNLVVPPDRLAAQVGAAPASGEGCGL
jgi:hypothetical protein